MFSWGVKGYRLRCIEHGRAGFITSRDVVFNEREMPLLKFKQQGSPSTTENGVSENSQIEVESSGRSESSD